MVITALVTLAKMQPRCLSTILEYRIYGIHIQGTLFNQQEK
jgi:hypothetical protein